MVEHTQKIEEQEEIKETSSMSVDEISEYLMMQLVVSYNLYRAVEELYQKQKVIMPDNLVQKIDEMLTKSQSDGKGGSSKGFFDILNFALLVVLLVVTLFLK